ncbi:MFS transporter [Corynebacterium sanguinis]|uniref:MFS transporter n=1 Tax=Corynebacterium sanguinis TaxID=2594913 RepID=UPI0021B03280|nr:MFS transporter [Corynebacterium sanguinis]MCT2288885.1 MFS transporter [Corynebacterium sanguinis]
MSAYTSKPYYKWIILLGSFLVYIFDAMEIQILSYALPGISEEYGITPIRAGLLATATLIGMGLSGPVMGYIADNRGRKFALLTCLVLFVTLTAAIYVVPSFSLFIFLRLLAGIGLGGVWSVLSAYVTETWPAHQRGKAIGFVLAAYPVGSALAAQLSSFLMPDWRLLFLIAGLSAMLPLAFVLIGFRESEVWKRDRGVTQEGESVSIKALFTGGRARLTIIASIVCILVMVPYYGATTWFPSYLARERAFDAQTIGNHFTLMSLTAFLGYFFFGWLADKVGRKPAIMASLISTGLLIAAYGYSTSPSILWVVAPLYSFCMVFPGLFAPYISELYPTRMRTTGSGFTYNVGRGLSALGPIVMGGIATAASFSTGIVIAGGLFLLAAVIMLSLPRVDAVTADDTEELGEREAVAV